MPCKVYYCTQGIRSYAHPGSKDSRRPRTETLRPCLWPLQPACPAPGHCHCLDTAHEWWLGWQAAVRKVLEKKEKTGAVCEVQRSLKKTAPLTGTLPEVSPCTAPPARGAGGVTAVSAPQLSSTTSEGDWTWPREEDTSISKTALRGNQDAQLPKVHSPRHCREQNPNEAANASLQWPLQSRTSCSSGWQADEECGRRTETRDNGRVKNPHWKLRRNTHLEVN